MQSQLSRLDLVLSVYAWDAGHRSLNTLDPPTLGCQPRAGRTGGEWEVRYHLVERVDRGETEA